MKVNRVPYKWIDCLPTRFTRVFHGSSQAISCSRGNQSGPLPGLSNSSWRSPDPWKACQFNCQGGRNGWRGRLPPPSKNPTKIPWWENPFLKFGKKRNWFSKCLDLPWKCLAKVKEIFPFMVIWPWWFTSHGIPIRKTSPLKNPSEKNIPPAGRFFGPKVRA